MLSTLTWEDREQEVQPGEGSWEHRRLARALPELGRWLTHHCTQGTPGWWCPMVVLPCSVQGLVWILSPCV